MEITVKTEKKLVSIELPAAMYEAIKQLSLDDDRSFSSFVRKILDDYLINISKQSKNC